MYELLCAHGKSVIEHGGPMSEVFNRLKLMHRAQCAIITAFGILMMIAICVIIESEATTKFSNSCIVSALLASIAFAVLEFWTLEEIVALAIVKQLFNKLQWEDFLPFLNCRREFTREVEDQLEQIRFERADPCFELVERVSAAMFFLTNDKAWAEKPNALAYWTLA